VEQTNLFIALGGLLILALVLASGVRRYQQRMAEKRLRIQRILRGVDLIEELLGRTGDCAPPLEIERLLREDIVARYRLVSRIDGRYQGIEALLVEAQQALAGCRDRGVDETGIEERVQMERASGALGELIGLLRQGGLLKPMAPEQLRERVHRLALRRAECVRRFYLARAEQLRGEARLSEALAQCQGLKTFLSENGPNCEKVREWYGEADTLARSIGDEIAAAAG